MRIEPRRARGVAPQARAAATRWRRLLVLSAAVVGGCGARAAEIEQGRALFSGERPLRARMVGHTLDLPQIAVGCTNCHQRQVSRAQDDDVLQTAGARPSQGFGPSLARERLMRAMPRRGGPPSAYDRSTFCRLLRDGIDPAFVMIPQSMPRYRFSDQECEALWTFLTTSTPSTTAACCYRDVRC